MASQQHFTPALQILNPSIAELDRAEEEERKARLSGSNQAAVNAYHVAEIVKGSGFPVPQGHQGSSKYFGTLEEQERERRLANKEEANEAKLRASVVSVLLQDAPTHVIPSHAGSFKFTRELEEQERARRINDVAECSVRRVRAQRISEGLAVNYSTIRARLVSHTLSAIALAKGKEVLATASATATVVADKAIAALPSKEEVSSAAHTAADVASAYVHKALDALPTKEEVKVVANRAAVVANEAAHVVADAAIPAATRATNTAIAAGHTISSYFPSVSSVYSAFSSVKDSVKDTVIHAKDSVVHAKDSVVSSVQHAYYGDEEIVMYTWSNISLLEEQERTRRLNDKDGVSKGNAGMIARLVTYANIYPQTKLSKNGGFIKHMSHIEEAERTRRLANKFESELREINAKKVSFLLNSLGWPFIRSAKFSTSQHFSETFRLSEEERTRRLADDESSFFARYNARKVSTLIKDASHREDKKSVLSQISKLEERERALRISNVGLAIHNARKEAHIIASLGWPFFVGGEKSVLERKEDLAQLNNAEEEERQFRMSLQKAREIETKRNAFANAAKAARFISFGAPQEQQQQQQPKISFDKQVRQVSQERAADIAHFFNQDTSLLEEQERKSRVADKYTQHQARANAYKVSGMINAFNKKSLQQSASLAAPAPVAASVIPPAPPAPVAAPKAAPVAPSAPVAAPKAAPIPPPLPVAAPKAAPVAPAPVAAPIQATFVAPAPVAAPTFVAPAPVAAPIQATFVAPAPVAAPIQATFVAPAPVAAPTFVAPAPVAAPTFVAPAPVAAAPIVAPAPVFQQAAPVVRAAPVVAAPVQKQQSGVGSIIVVDQKLIDKVRKLHDQEVKLAKEEQQKLASLQSKNKKGALTNFRVKKHQHSEAKHLANAQRHEQWLSAQESLLPRSNIAGSPAF